MFKPIKQIRSRIRRRLFWINKTKVAAEELDWLVSQYYDSLNHQEVKEQRDWGELRGGAPQVT